MFSRTKMVRLMLSVAFAAMLAPVVGQWFVKLFEQWGAYDDPARQVGAATSWVSALIASPAYQRGLTLVAGAAVGAWLDWLARRIDRKRQRPKQNPSKAELYG